MLAESLLGPNLSYPRYGIDVVLPKREWGRFSICLDVPVRRC